MNRRYSTGVDVPEFATLFDELRKQICTHVLGAEDVVSNSLICLFAGGHLLIEDVPGVGKTLLATSLAAAIDADCRRIQFTPDLLPGDITGTMVLEGGALAFRKGPVFANLVLCDEINRASPKTQSALLEVMAEGTVSIPFEERSRTAADPFMVVATQNPVEMAGTYPLPEAQLDRFLMCVTIGYPPERTEIGILRSEERRDRVEPVVSAAVVSEMVAGLADAVRVAESIQAYIVRLVARTRSMPDLVTLGVSPRGSIALQQCARVRAAAEGRDFVSTEDVKALAVPALAHRIQLGADAVLRNVQRAAVISHLLATVPAPQGL